MLVLSAACPAFLTLLRGDLEARRGRAPCAGAAGLLSSWLSSCLTVKAALCEPELLSEAETPAGSLPAHAAPVAQVRDKSSPFQANEIWGYLLLQHNLTSPE